MDPTATPSDLIAFWRDAGPQAWFRKDDDFDDRFRTRFLRTHEAAARGELDSWPESADGALALVLLLDQFPRNAFRGDARMYATDAQARDVARNAISRGHDRACDTQLRPFFYMPFMHAEDLADHYRCDELMQEVGGESLRFAQHHRSIIERFGRFPHRNAVLGRESTPDELEFLREGGFGG